MKVYQSPMLDIGSKRNGSRLFLLSVQEAFAKKTMAENNNINIGMAIREELKRQERSVAWFARKLGTSRMACYRIFESYSIDTYMLLKISRALNHDFFALYSDSMKCEDIM